MDSGRHSYCPCLPGALWAEAPDFHSVYFSCQDPSTLNDPADVLGGGEAGLSEQRTEEMPVFKFALRSHLSAILRKETNQNRTKVQPCSTASLEMSAKSTDFLRVSNLTVSPSAGLPI